MVGEGRTKDGHVGRSKGGKALVIKGLQMFFPSLLLGKGLKGEDKGAKIGKGRLIVSLPFRLGPYVAAKYTGKFWRFAFNIFFPFLTYFSWLFVGQGLPAKVNAYAADL